MQGLADGYFVLPYTIGDYLANTSLKSRHGIIRRLSLPSGSHKRTRTFWKQGQANGRIVPSRTRKLVWDECGMARQRTGLKRALAKIPELREEFGRT